MGELVRFRPRGGRERKRENESARDESAQILFFTGVRYQRYGEADESPAIDQRAPPSGDMGGAGGGRRKRRG
jgi:hypothetical protein